MAMYKNLFNKLIFLLTILTTTLSFNTFAQDYRLSCDFSNRESDDYIKRFLGHNPWIIDVNIKNKYFEHISHSKRISSSSVERKQWLDGDGIYKKVKIIDKYLIAEKKQFNFKSYIKLHLETGHLKESFDIKIGSSGVPLDWNAEHANADCEIVVKKKFNIK